jgi:hypothetical protein
MNKKNPLIVDLDGTLIYTDILHESLIIFFKSYIFSIVNIFLWLFQGKAYLKDKISSDYLKDKKTKIVLYTYDAFLFDYAEEDGNILPELVKLLQYPVSIKQGTSYHGLTKI